MASGYKPGLTIERINVDGNYDPSNCTWVTREAQVYNKRDNRKIVFHGQTMCVGELSITTGVPYHRLYQRLFKLGWSVERAVAQ
jgi:hypothetical protein